MVKIITGKKEILKNKEGILSAILSGKIFIYPTDTIYGIGCNAMAKESVEKIRSIKKRDERPLSIIAPSKKWVVENCEASKKELEKLPGPYTLFVNLKNKSAIAENVNPKESSLGVRIPDHWFTKFIEEANIPFITTSVNISGEPYMQSIDDIDAQIKKSVDYILYDGPIIGQTSTKIDLRKK